MPSSLQSQLEAAQSEVDLPVIDISKFPHDFDGEGLNNLQHHPLMAAIREAWKEWGFFRVVNHGIPQDLLEDVQSASRELYSMPKEAKDRVTNSNPSQSYTRVPFELELPWYETFCFPDMPNSNSLEEACAKIWPQQGNPNVCQTLGRFNLSLSNLAEKIIKIILASLCLDVKAFYQSDFKKCTDTIRITHYSSHGKSIGEEALLCHADVGCLTILYQDDMGGLEIRSSEGKWFNVKPQSDSFIVNVGDSLKAWTNGRCRSAEHRVIYTGWKERMSIGYFYVFPDDTEIWAPPQLVDDDNPRRYKPFIFSEFRNEIQNKPAVGDKAKTLDRLAGI